MYLDEKLHSGNYATFKYKHYFQSKYRSKYVFNNIDITPCVVLLPSPYDSDLKYLLAKSFNHLDMPLESNDLPLYFSTLS